jgi:hypothetical protein
MTAPRQKKRLSAMDTKHDPSRAALTAFLRRVFTMCAVQSEKDAKSFRKVLETLR